MCSSPRQRTKRLLKSLFELTSSGKLSHWDLSWGIPQPLKTLHMPMKKHFVHASMLCILLSKRRLGQESVVLNGCLSTLCQYQELRNLLQQTMEVSSLTILSFWVYWLLVHLFLRCSHYIPKRLPISWINLIYLISNKNAHRQVSFWMKVSLVEDMKKVTIWEFKKL